MLLPKSQIGFNLSLHPPSSLKSIEFTNLALNVLSIHVGVPLMKHQTVKVPGKHVNVKWKTTFEGACPADKYTVYYREVNLRQWKLRHVPKGIAQCDLQLECFKEYDVAVTATWTRNVETPINDSTRWKVVTGQGKQTKLQVLFIVEKSKQSTAQSLIFTLE